MHYIVNYEIDHHLLLDQCREYQYQQRLRPYNVMSFKIYGAISQIDEVMAQHHRRQ